MTYTQEQIAAISDAFTKGLQAEMPAASWSEMLARHSLDTLHCPSHDYCDANMIMGAAIYSVIGPQPDSDELEAATVEAWDAAWTMARKSWGQV